jgi:hypothetical protein
MCGNDRFPNGRRRRPTAAPVAGSCLRLERGRPKGGVAKAVRHWRVLAVMPPLRLSIDQNAFVLTSSLCAAAARTKQLREAAYKRLGTENSAP